MSPREQKPQRPSPKQLEVYHNLMRRIELRDVQLCARAVMANKDFVAAHGVVDSGVEVSLKIRGHGRLSASPQHLICEMQMQWKAQKPTTDDDLVSIQETYLVTYSLEGDDPVPEETIQAFADNNAAFNAWPFFRESLHSTTMRMGLPAYTLPLLKPSLNNE